METEKGKKSAFEEKSNEDNKKLQLNYQNSNSDFKEDKEKLEVVLVKRIEYEIERNKNLEEKISVIKSEQKQDLMEILNNHKEDLKKLKVRKNIY